MVVILVGTNNHGDSPEQIAEGLKAICTMVRDKLPRAFLILLVIFHFGYECYGSVWWLRG
jgi:platelet-activating factor acetylhydrolase IB subunit beta/gamma